VLIVHDKPAGGGGIRRHVEDAAGLLRGAGHEASLLRLTSLDDGAAAREDAVFPQTFDPVSGRRHRSALRRIVTGTDPDVIHVHAGFTSLSAVLLRDLATHRPTVGQFHDVGSFCYLGTRRFMSRDELCGRRVGIGCWRTGCYRPADPVSTLRAAARSIVRADLLSAWRQLPRVVVPSGYLRDVAALHGFRHQQLRVVPNFCLPASAPAHIRRDPPLILFVGALIPTKGAHLLLEALGQVAGDRWRAAIVGEGPERAGLEQQSRHLGLSERVEFLGARNRSDLDALYAECRMLVHASTIPESFGLVGIEAMAHGAPVVGFHLGGVNEWLVDGGTGIAVPPWSVAALATGIRSLLQNPDLAAALGAAARARTQQLFAPEQFLAAILGVYTEASEGWRGKWPG